MENTNTIITIERDLAKEPPEPFAEEAEFIRREHEMVIYDAGVVLERSAGIGEKLSQIKSALKTARGHGSWTPWCERNLPEISASTIRRYMQVFRRKSEPLALEDPGAFMNAIYGNLELEDDDADPSDSKTIVNDRFENGKKPAPAKRVRKRKAKDAPPPPSEKIDNSPPPKPVSVGKLSLELRLANAADALEEAWEEWTRVHLESLLEDGGATARIANGLEEISEELDGFSPGVAGRLREYSRSLAS
jgi:hypothetical protein